ncbi:ABC transporter permease [Pseudonocardia sp.]|uniref:ABC transporter permease n=1 Tax=Pseudonocardia sp. TaxID=60912 RepID=UPI002614FAFA|nr:ABC transporter permease [Pseudonocardia sp.]
MTGVVDWFADPANWSGPDGVPVRLLEHLQYTLLAVVIAGVIAIPIGLWIGHTGRGGFLVVGSANALRALPTFGLLVLLANAFGIALTPPIVALVILAIPPMLAGTYAGVQAVDRAIVDAARGMGMDEREVLLRVELPNALPLILGGVRSATLQIIATATIAAYVALGGLGRYIIDGLALRDFAEMAAGSILLALLAISIDLVLAAVQRTVVSPGLRSVPTSRPRPRLRAV